MVTNKPVYQSQFYACTLIIYFVLLCGLRPLWLDPVSDLNELSSLLSHPTEIWHEISNSLDVVENVISVAVALLRAVINFQWPIPSFQ